MPGTEKTHVFAMLPSGPSCGPSDGELSGNRSVCSVMCLSGETHIKQGYVRRR